MKVGYFYKKTAEFDIRSYLSDPLLLFSGIAIFRYADLSQSMMFDVKDTRLLETTLANSWTYEIFRHCRQRQSRGPLNINLEPLQKCLLEPNCDNNGLLLCTS